jgi:tripartite-type tricarboxylate transporter receptor subunit TctC
MTTANRFFLMQDVPTLVEQGLLTAGFANWFGVMAPAKTPTAIVQTLAKEINAVVKSPDTRAALQAQGVEPFALSTQEEFQSFVASELARWGEIIRAANIRREEK